MVLVSANACRQWQVFIRSVHAYACKACGLVCMTLGRFATSIALALVYSLTVLLVWQFPAPHFLSW